MANITRIKAKDSPKEPEELASDEPKKAKKQQKVPKNEEKAAKKSLKKATKAKKPMSAPIRFITWPFRYVHESWVELRQVRWPSRGATWKMVLAVLAYTALFIVIIMLLDALFTLIFNQLLS